MTGQDHKVVIITGGSPGIGAEALGALHPLGHVGQVSDIVGGQVAGH
jgi:NAD(P)-dependent dehydrogenase (short-subunit alcohol dehydrogenase family)